MYCKGNDVFYMSLEGGNVNLSDKMEFLREVSGQKKRFRLFDAKEQIKLLHRFTSVLLEGSYEDPKTAHWLLSKTWREKGYSSIVVEHIPEATKLTSQLGPLLGFSGPGLYAKSSVIAKTRACHEAFLSFHVMERQLRLLQGKLLLKLFQQVEMPLILNLAEMELVGFRFDRDKLLDIKKRLDSVQSELSEKAYSFAQYKFSLASTAAVSKLLYNDLKLGKGDGHLTKKQKPSTSKEALQELAVETNHPLPDIILDWRKIQSVITKVLSPLLQIESEIPRLYSVTQTYTATGRLAMQEPNLQNMPRNFCISFGNDDPDISIREIFTASEGCSLLSVDYCQIELRLLAHLSRDQKLIDSINTSADVFVNIAANIYGVPECNVDDDLRQRAKKTCYGIIYGIGARSLSHQLRVEESIALALMEDFKDKYKGVSLYLENTLKDCRKKGYVTSLMGRRRYLPYINDPNPAIKSEAERQAINTTIQGSAADLLKISMVKIREKIKELNEENLTVNLLLHLHDELLFEVSHGHTETVAVILKETMENVFDLKVPTPVKLHIGPSWGQLRLYDI
ncbi:UNVERIFIED_CONTAM: hypothetical protein PYX00_006201 [Menopon gallinae]|uniref:DNA-directed DNA polymerase n=1 Tax=Menopon gallinae TaxID=328185 RepID=A0AAW2HVS6_9NEOP